MRVRKGTILYAAGVLACGNVLLQVLGFVYRVVLSRFAGAEGLGVYRLVNSVYLVLNAGCLSGVTTACSRLSAACEARGESHRLGAVLRLAFRAFFALSAACTAVVLLCGGAGTGRHFALTETARCMAARGLLQSDKIASLDLAQGVLAGGAPAPRLHIQRSAEEERLICRAKAVLMEVNLMSEAEAHRFLQKYSMDTGLRLAETARLILERYTTG